MTSGSFKLNYKCLLAVLNNTWIMPIYKAPSSVMSECGSFDNVNKNLVCSDQATQRRTHTFNMWPQRGECEEKNVCLFFISHYHFSEVEKTSSWPNTTKIMTSLKMESSTIKAVLKLLLITLTFAFLSTACSCSTATFVKVPIASVARLNMNSKISGVVTFLNLHTKTT